MIYVHAFFKAVRLTLKGERYVRPYEELWCWIEGGSDLLKSVKNVMERANFDVTQQKAMTIHIEGRDMSLWTIVGSIEHHLMVEYPYLLQHLTYYSITGIYAANMNDQFYLSRLLENEMVSPAPIKFALVRLRTHLQKIPSSVEESTLM